MNPSHTQVVVPPEWKEDADEMDVSYAEYVRRMTQAGRLQWGHEHIEEPEMEGLREEKPQSSGLQATLQSAVLENLSTTSGISEDELAELLFDDLIDELQIHLQELKDSGKADYNPRDGGWVKVTEETQ